MCGGGKVYRQKGVTDKRGLQNYIIPTPTHLPPYPPTHLPTDLRIFQSRTINAKNQPVTIKGFDVNMHGVHLKKELSNCNQDKIQDKICNSCKGLPSDWCMF